MTFLNLISISRPSSAPDHHTAHGTGRAVSPATLETREPAASRRPVFFWKAKQ
jgi:hypothetical protein